MEAENATGCHKSQLGKTPNSAVIIDLDTDDVLSPVVNVKDLDTDDVPSPRVNVKRTLTSTGSRVSAPINNRSKESEEMKSIDGLMLEKVPVVNAEPSDGFEQKEEAGEEKPPKKMAFDEFLKATNTKVMSEDECLKSLIEMPKVNDQEEADVGCGPKVEVTVKEEVPNLGVEEKVSVKEETGDSDGHLPWDMTFKEHCELEEAKSKAKAAESCKTVKQEGEWNPNLGFEKPEVGLEQKVSVTEERIRDSDEGMTFQEFSEEEAKNNPKVESCKTLVKQERNHESEWNHNPGFENKVKRERMDVPLFVEPLSMRPAAIMGSNQNFLKPSPFAQRNRGEDQTLSTVVIEDGDFQEDPDWLLVGRTPITGLSTTKGRKLENNEIVHLNFPSADTRSKSVLGSAKAAAAAAGIVRFSTRRSGEIGRLPMEWAKCLIPLVNSSKVKVLARCVAVPINLQMMQEIMLYASFYIHQSVFTDCDKSSWRLDAPSNIDSTVYPLLTLFKLLKIKPFQKAEFTPAELDSRKRRLNLGGDSDEEVSVLPMAKRIKGVPQYPEPNKDEQVISESSLNKLVGAVDMYDLEEMEPPETLACNLRSYQKQALYWMSESEKGIDVEKAAKTLHPCWAAYRICDERASAIYVNNFSGEATTQFPAATQMARGGILADAMGLGKTVMTIALILTRLGRGCPDNNDNDPEDSGDTEYIKKRRLDADVKVPEKVRGGTLIVCPMALLSQWKDELETHSHPECISIFVHYGGGRSNDPRVLAEPDVVLTTYGVLTAACKTYGENSIFHRVDWYRVVLDEAHTIKASKTQGAQATFSLSSHCRWCLTGTPLQNNLEDLYSLLCFLHVEPWCNWAWWNKLIQKPYENGDMRGLRLIKAILRPLMLRRTKETKDKQGRPILVLPPTDIRVIDCEQSEVERDFYDALFRRSKVQFDQFVAQGKVLHNYANILELLLRLRQCCNHPFLVMSRGDTQEYADLNKLAKMFLETNPDSTSTQKLPSRAYIEEVVEEIRRGENTECPICLESADDTVLTPCAHRMCRECLLSSWRTPTTGFCPICRQVLKKNELITCPTENKFRVDVDKNWKESSKVSKLLDCLKRISSSGSGEKSIVFSQWTSFLDLLEIPLKRKGIEFLRFDGKLSQKQREKVLKEFNETTEKTVMLMSLKTGGVGLNLTAASNVFLMDPWWNPAVEEQAIMRIHRIGQKRTVRVRRFIVKDTVEARLQQVQARKERMIAGALTDEEVRSARLEELKMLFR